MASLGIRKFQDLIGRTDLLRAYENTNNPKAKLLNFNLILKNALHMRPGVNIVGGSEKQVCEVKIGIYFFTVGTCIIRTIREHIKTYIIFKFILHCKDRAQSKETLLIIKVF